MTRDENAHLWELMERVRFCMLCTHRDNQIHARPMGAFVRRKENAVYFFTDARAHKDDEVEEASDVCLAFADVSGQKYVSINGVAEVVDDRGKIRELWSIPSKIWWDSPEDPNIRLIKVTPRDGEYWDSPGNLVSSVKVAWSLATGAEIDYGEHKKIGL
ncbi:MAG: pyridoxamine 5'-phosphate oxidase family protein [Alphaproteobacteria bacterium]|nr:pyridoxamine 5'-phosphate oxidase family protein [Alphaproteobacteria bacterium]